MWQQFAQAVEGRFSGARALWQAWEQYRLERWFTFANFSRSADRVAEQLAQFGLDDVCVEEFPADGVTSWSGWTSFKAWEVEAARLWLTSPQEELLSDWSVVPQALVMYSGPCAVEAEVVEWDGALDVDLTGKLPFTRHRVNDVYAPLCQLGVPGIVSDFIGTLPGVRDPFDVPDEVRWENSGLRPAKGRMWGFMLTPRQGQRLRELMRDGPVRLRAEIRSEAYDGTFKSATGVIQGADLVDEEVLLSSHLYEPGGNDNASGVGVGLELARCLQEAIHSGALPRPRRSLRFLFNWEGNGLMAWFERHRDEARRIIGGLNLDEIGVDQGIGRSVTHLFMPPAANPSVIGDLALHLSEQILLPKVRVRPVADRAEIINDTITADPSFDAVLPCLIQYPAKYYHTSGDTPDTLSPEVMGRFGVLAATHLLTLANAGPAEAEWLGRLALQGLRRKLGEVELRLMAGQWPFSAARTRSWFVEQAQLKAASLARLGTPEAAVTALAEEGQAAMDVLLSRESPRFQPERAREATPEQLEQARSLVLRRLTPGAPKAWESLALTPAEEATYLEVLFGNNLDLLFHRLVYWADGRRTLLEIVERLEFELDELLQDTAIARTASGSQIGGRAGELSLGAVLYIVDLLVRNGYLATMPSETP